MRTTGTVTFWDDARGFGFLTRADDGGAVFVHRSQVHITGIEARRVSLRKGQRVAFDVAQATKGPAATNVTLLTEGQ